MRRSFSLKVLSLIAFLLAGQARAQHEVTIGGSLKSNRFDVTISGIEPKTASIFEVDSPNRLVIDLPITKKKVARKNISENAFAKKIRVGTHPNKTRIVIDLVDPKPGYFSSPSKDGLIISLSREEKGDGAKVEKEVPTATPVHELKVEPTATSVPKVIPTREPTAVPSSTPTEEEVVVPTHTAVSESTEIPEPEPTHPPTKPTPTSVADDVEKSPEPTLAPREPTLAAPPESTGAATAQSVEDAQGQRVMGINFKKDTQGSLIELNLVERTEFSLSKVKNRRFKLTIPHCTVNSKGLLLPHFPPNDVTGFTLIQIMPGVDAIDVFIGVDDGMKVNAASVGNTIALRAAPAGF